MSLRRAKPWDLIKGGLIIIGLFVLMLAVQSCKTLEWIENHLPRPTPTPAPTNPPTPSPSPTATPSPSPTPSPSATATPVPTAPGVGECPCLVVCTIALLGVNDNPWPPIRVGDNITFDVTCRHARQNGDTRGLPCDNPERIQTVCKGRTDCDPEENPVRFETSVPDGTRVVEVNGGWGISLRNVQAGPYHLKVSPGSFYSGKVCPWGHDTSTKNELRFTLPN